jgi:competence protein ComEC
LSRHQFGQFFIGECVGAVFLIQTSFKISCGKPTSSTVRFLETVKPELALFQVGYRNRYPHPKPEVFERYRELGIERIRSDESGAVTLQFGATREVIEYRSQHARYWYGQ